MLEEVAAMAATFLLLLLLVQVTAAMTARSAADAALAATVSRSALPDADLGLEAERLRRVVPALVPGATGVEVVLTRHRDEVRGLLRVIWQPPGPGFGPISMTLQSEVPLAVAP